MEKELPITLVMTSANRSGDPLVTDNDEALETLSEIADRFLLHNRDIVVRCDDSVVRVANDETVFIRRARGWAPEGLRLPETVSDDATSVVAYGPYLKNTAALLRGRDAWLTQHIGTLSNPKNLTMLEETVEHFEKLFEVTPQIIACDAHPDFGSTRIAARVAHEKNLPLYPIYHHAAHIGVVMAETARTVPTFGLALDGVGLGPNEGIWGGEALLVDAEGFARVGHMQEIPLPGGDRAAQEPWRMGAAILHTIGMADAIPSLYADQKGAVFIEKLIDNATLTAKTIFASGVHAWHFGGFPTNESAASEFTAFGNTTDDASCGVDIEFATTKVVKEKHTTGTLNQNVVDAHGDKILSNRIVSVELKSQH